MSHLLIGLRSIQVILAAVGAIILAGVSPALVAGEDRDEDSVRVLKRLGAARPRLKERPR